MRTEENQRQTIFCETLHKSKSGGIMKEDYSEDGVVHSIIFLVKLCRY